MRCWSFIGSVRPARTRPPAHCAIGVVLLTAACRPAAPDCGATTILGTVSGWEPHVVGDAHLSYTGEAAVFDRPVAADGTFVFDEIAPGSVTVWATSNWGAADCVHEGDPVTLCGGVVDVLLDEVVMCEERG
ncbi:MAG: hypothetical protein Q8P41_25085 [Pseudomonadota bacterium]|nr:hypothetical protein [Pseudomonadota bacterium]